MCFGVAKVTKGIYFSHGVEFMSLVSKIITQRKFSQCDPICRDLRCEPVCAPVCVFEGEGESGSEMKRERWPVFKIYYIMFRSLATQTETSSRLGNGVTSTET